MLKYNQYSPLKKEKLDFQKYNNCDSFKVRIYSCNKNKLEETFYNYSAYFYKAAHRVAHYLIETSESNISERDTFFFTLAFLYRHSLELILKALAFEKIRLKDDRKKFIKERFHDIEKLFSFVKNQISDYIGIDELSWLGNYFASIAKIDHSVKRRR